MLGTPYFLEDGVARERLAARVDQAHQDVELGRRHLDDGGVSADLARRDVDDDVAELERVRRRRLVAVTTAKRGADAREELREAERLRDVVLGAELEPRDLVDLAGAGRKNDDRHAETFAAERLQYLEAVHV